MSRRETFYECAFLQAGEECHLVVRAWNVRGARQHVATELKSAGLPVPARIAVRPLSRTSPPAPAFEAVPGPA